MHSSESFSYPLTPIQQGMLFHHVRSPRSGVDIEQMVATLREPVDAAALQAACRWLVARHDVLRTGFEWEQGPEPRQIVHASTTQDGAPLPWREEDWRGLSADEQARRFDAFLLADRQDGFDPRVAPLARWTLLRLDGEARLVWTFHHMLADGQSYPTLIRELFDRYDAERGGTVVTTPESERVPAYRTFIEWRQANHAQASAETEAFWRDTLAGFTAPTPIVPPAASGQASPASAGPAWRARTRALSIAATDALRSLALSTGVTLATAVEAAWALVLAANSGEDDVLFGVTRACRRDTVPRAADIVGSFINTVPVRVRIDRDRRVSTWLQDRRAASVGLRAFEHASLLDVHKWSQVPGDRPLFESLLVYTPRLIGPFLREQGGAWTDRDIQFHEQTNFPVALFAYGEPALLLKLAYDSARLPDAAIDRWLAQLDTILTALPAHADRTVGELPVLSPEETRQLVETWNATARPFDDACVHALIERQVARTPQATALIFRGESITYDELNRRANRVARDLQSRGIAPGQMVGIFVDRSIAMMVGLLGILKAGAAYVPMDPAYPGERLAWMLEDANAPVVLTQAHLAASLPASSAAIVVIDERPLAGTDDGATNPASGVTPDDLAYVIFTSGSSGRPKGVMLEHRNVANFFAGMDDALGFERPGVWLAVTSISFDISVLELFWTLSRGFTIVIQEEPDKLAMRGAAARDGASSVASRRMDFSLFYFSADAGESATNRYRLLLEGAKYADANGFSAVWTPERHFHAFGGLYPNPAVTSAAIAAITSHVSIRAGSVVLPLHDPIRVAEEWAVVDNLSNGRVGLSFASGWHVNDFALKPENYADRKAVMLKGIETVRRLWRGEAVEVRNGNGQPIEVRIFPAPAQREPQLWLTSAGNIDSFRMAGAVGANLLTNLLGQTPDDVAAKIAAYRTARRDAGHAGEGIVSLMLHTFVGADLDEVREIVRRPFIEYLRTSTELVKQARWEFPAFATPGKRQGPIDNSDLSSDEIDAMLNHAFERYFQTSGLFGTPDVCVQMIERLKAAGVDEIACLIDFGVASDLVLANLSYLNEVRIRSNANVPVAAAATASATVLAATTPHAHAGVNANVNADADAHVDYSIAAQIVRHGVTHLQCTPSLLRAVLLDGAGAEALKRIEVLMLGGEPLPSALAAEVVTMLGRPDGSGGRLLNMYGPTETTVWSATAHIASAADPVTIGRPIANTQIYLVDRRMQLAPIGAAGELLIGGTSVARGYLDRPELTAEKFIDDPFPPNPPLLPSPRWGGGHDIDAEEESASAASPRLGEEGRSRAASARGSVRGPRLYRTGDLARYREDGRIEFLGRLDHQVKVRGHRIELGEIESAFGRCDDVEQAVVMARKGADGQPRLVAYIVPRRSDDAQEGQAAGVERWRAVWDDAYQRGASQADAPGAAADAAFDISGWKSSYTGETLPDADMREYVAHTVDRILRHRPRRVLEIGCGTGLIALRLAPQVEHYTGVDVSASAVARLKEVAAARGLTNVTVCAASADVALAAAAEARPLATAADSADRAAASETDDAVAASGTSAPGMAGKTSSGSDERSALGGPFDTIVLNSVVQYFPDVDYLGRVLSQAAALLAPGGTIIVGDVRHLGLLEAFHTSVELARAAADTTRDELRRRIGERVQDDAELVIAPDYFHALPALAPGITGVTIEPKRGRLRNELTQFRYDVTLHVGGNGHGPGAAYTPAPTGATIGATADSASGAGALTPDTPRAVAAVAASGNGDNAAATLDDLRAAVARVAASGNGGDATNGAVALRGLRDARLARELAAVALLHADDGPRTAGELRARLQALPEAGLEIEDIYALASAHTLDVRVASSVAASSVAAPPTSDGLAGERAIGAGASGHAATSDRYDVMLLPRQPFASANAAANATPAAAGMSATSSVVASASSSAANLAPAKPWRDYVHEPPKDTGRLVRRWKQHLRDTLPDYMVPGAFVILEALPLTPNGKIDRKALPEPDRARTESSSSYVAPASDLERIIAEVWGELLGLDRVGTADTFFSLGANSLLMMQAHAALREKLQRPLSLIDLFQYPTVASLAASLTASAPASASTALNESEARAQARVDAMARRRQGRLATRTPSQS